MGGVKYFKLQISKAAARSAKDLIIVVNPERYDSVPTVLISEEHFPRNESDTVLYKCSSYGKETCNIHKDDIDYNGAIYYIAVISPSQCSFSIAAQYTSEINLALGYPLQLRFNTNEVKMLKFTLPPE